MYHVATTHQDTFFVEGKSPYVFALPDGQQVKGQDMQPPREWPWWCSEQVPGVRYARLRATSPIYRVVTLASTPRRPLSAIQHGGKGPQAPSSSGAEGLLSETSAAGVADAMIKVVTLVISR